MDPELDAVKAADPEGERAEAADEARKLSEAVLDAAALSMSALPKLVRRSWSPRRRCGLCRRCPRALPGRC